MKIYRDKYNNYFIEILRSQRNSVGLCYYSKGKRLRIDELGSHINETSSKEVELYELAFSDNNILEKINKSIETIKKRVRYTDLKVNGNDYIFILLQEKIQEMIKEINEIKNI